MDNEFSKRFLNIKNKIEDDDFFNNLNLKELNEYIKENFNKRDVILVQGSWGYTYSLVKWAIEEEYIPVYSYIERKRWRKCEKN